MRGGSGRCEVIEWLILIVLVGVFAVVLAALRLGGLRGDDWDLLAAKQRQRWDAERRDMGFRKCLTEKGRR
jgi:hypothetical protein